MRINKQVVDQLSRYFVRRDKQTTFGGDLVPDGDDAHNIGSSDNRVNILYARSVVADNWGTTEGGGDGNADMVDGFHASDTPTANYLLALDGTGKFPSSAIPSTTPSAHDIIGSQHTITGSAFDLVGATATDTLGLLTPSSNPGASESLLKTNSNGHLQVVGLGVGVSPASQQPLKVGGTLNNPGSYVQAINVSPTVTDTTTDFFGVISAPEINPSGGTSEVYVGVEGRPYHISTNTLSGTMYGLVGAFYQTGAGTVSSVIGVQAGNIYNPSGTITTRTGVYIPDTSGNTVTNYGLRIANIDGGSSSNWAIRSEGGDIWLSGDVGIGADAKANTKVYVAYNASGQSGQSVGTETYAYSSDTGSGGITASLNRAYFQDTSAGVYTFYGAENSIYHSTGATLSSATGTYSTAYLYSTGTITSFSSFRAGAPYTPSGGSVGTYYGLYVNPLTSSTVTNAYGIYVSALANASGTEWALYSADSGISIGGDLQFRQASVIETTTGNLDIDAGSDLFRMLDNTEMRSDHYASQTTGWHITYGGDADFRSLFASEIHTEAFIADVYESLVGAIIVTKSRAKLSRNFTPPFGALITGIDGDVSNESIVDVSTTSEWFEINGDFTSDISIGDKFTVAGSTGNDGVWEVQSVSFVSPDTRIVVTGNITDATVDGAITFHHYFSISGDHTSDGSIVATDTVYVNYSTGNDGTYTVSSVSYDSTDVETDIYVSTAIPSITADGGIGKTGTIYLQDHEGLEETAVFSANDIIRLRVMDTSGGGLLVTDVWGLVSNYSNLSGGEQSFTFTAIDSEDAFGNSSSVYAGAIALDYGQQGSGSQGIWEATVLDGAGSPYSGVKTWDTNPWESGNWTTNVRVGNLQGITTTLEYGFWAGTGTGNTDQELTLSDQTVEFKNIPLRMLDSSGDYKVRIESDGDVFFGTDVDSPLTTTFVHFSNDQSYDGESMTAGDLVIGDVRNTNIKWDAGTGHLQFRYSSIIKSYIDTSGDFVSGSGIVKFGYGGISLYDQGSIFTVDYGSTFGGMYFTIPAPTGDYYTMLWDIGTQASNGITNCCFETDLSNWTYSFSGSEDVGGFWRVSGNDAPEGNYYAQVTASDNFAVPHSAWVTSNQISASAGDVFVIDLWARTVSETGDDGFIQLKFSGGTYGIDEEIHTYSQWRKVHLISSIAPSGTTYVELIIGIEGAGGNSATIRFDDVSVAEVTTYAGIELNRGLSRVEISGDMLLKTGDLTYPGALNATRGGFNHSGSIFVPVTPTNLEDTASNTWNFTFSASASTTYDFDPADNSSLWPEEATAVLILYGGKWSSASDSYSLSARKNGASTNEAQIRANVASILQLEQAVVQTDASGIFELVVSSGSGISESGCRLLGYYV